MMWRLGIDVGTNSIGFSVLELDQTQEILKPVKILDLGVRIFTDGRNPKDLQSLAAMRRTPRGMRRNRDRAKNRNARYLGELRRYGLLPDEDRPCILQLDPYILRLKGLDEKLDLHAFGRALWHLKRRGFKSNRKTDGGDQEGGKIRDASDRTRQALKEENCRTLGEWLGKPRLQTLIDNECHKAGERKPMPQARVRLRGKGAKAFYDFYPTREMILEEFDLLWQVQQKWHPEVLTPEAKESLRETLAFQWPLKPQPVGRCTFDPDQPRAPRALPSVQRLRILQELNHLGIIEPGKPLRSLTLEERDQVLQLLLRTKKQTFDGIRKALRLPQDARFNLESASRQHLDGDQTAARLSSKNLWDKSWRDLSATEQDRIVERLLEEQNETALVEWLQKEYSLAPDRADAVSRVTLPAGHGAFCREVTARLTPHLEASVLSFDKAALAAGFHHSDFRDGEVYPDGLPYYGKILQREVAFGSGNPTDPEEKRLGKIANPTVHVALNEIRKVVNDLISIYGTPSQIVVELARDLPLSAQGRRDLEKQQRENREANQSRDKELDRLGIPRSYENRLRLRLWEELNQDNVMDRRCVFTGEQISIERLFSSEVEIEHLLPFSRTLDDSIGNKVLCMRQANRIKTNKTPHEAFGGSPEWADILNRAASLPENKFWRFSPDAMDRYNTGERDFLNRQLNDTRYIARLTKGYLEKTGADTWVNTGRLTSDLRWALGLDSVLPGHNSAASGTGKNRLDHRHHAVDALVVGLCDRSMMKKVSELAAKQETASGVRLLPGLDEPWEGFRDAVVHQLERLVVSHKPDHGVQGPLHNDTAYGILDPQAPAGEAQEVVRRVAVSDIHKASDIERIRDPELRSFFQNVAETATDKNLVDVLSAAGETLHPPVRRVRVVEKLRVIPIGNGRATPFKAYKGDGNYCYDLFEDQKGRWTGIVINRFDANQKDFDPHSGTGPDGHNLVMRIRVNDMLELEHEGSRQVMRIAQISPGKITLAGHTEAGSLKARNADKEDSFRYLTFSPSSLQKLGAVRVTVSPAGRLFRKQPEQ